jgi:uncharacterized RDD family membrane protein YckC
MAYGPPTTLDPTNVMGRRIAAWFIDALIPTVIALAVGWSVFVGTATKYSPEPTGYCTEVHFQQPGAACFQLGNDVWVGTSADAHHAFAVGGLIYLIGAVNLFVIQGLTGAAIGKHMLGLRVVRENGSLVTFGWNALRTLLLVVDQFFCALPGIITAGVTHPHRRIGDFAAGTFVVAKQSVGTPIAVAMGGSAYPPPWTPPGAPVGGGPPPAGGAQPWGAPAPGWGAPAGASPAPTQAPPTWGAPSASPPPSQAPATWGAPAPGPQPEPTPTTWGTPASATEPVATPAPQAAAHAPPSREPQWDAQRNAWVFWEVETSRWLQHDPVTGQWGPLR